MTELKALANPKNDLIVSVILPSEEKELKYDFLLASDNCFAKANQYNNHERKMQVKCRLKCRFLHPAPEILILVLWNTTQEGRHLVITLDDTRVQELYFEGCCHSE